MLCIDFMVRYMDVALVCLGVSRIFRLLRWIGQLQTVFMLAEKYIIYTPGNKDKLGPYLLRSSETGFQASKDFMSPDMSREAYGTVSCLSVSRQQPTFFERLTGLMFLSSKAEVSERTMQSKVRNVR